MNYEWDIPVTCPDCGHRAEYAIKVADSEIGGHAAPEGQTRLKCVQCHALLGVTAELSLDVWDRSAHSEG